MERPAQSREPVGQSGARGWWSSSAAWVISAVVVIELVLHVVLPGRYFNHEVDRLLYRIDHDQTDADVFLIGDSVGKGIFDRLRDDPAFADLACNQAIEMTGQYFLVHRAMRRYGVPEAVVFCGIDPRSGDLEQSLTENYFQRCFTHWSEIGAVLRDKQNPVFTTKTVAYKFFASFKYRTHLQDKILGVTDLDLRPLRPPEPSGDEASSDHALFGVVERALRRRRGERLSILYLRRLASDLQDRDVRLYDLPAPTRPDAEDMVGRILIKLDPLQQEFPNFHVLDSLYRTYPDELFADGTHLNARGLDAHLKVVRPALRQISENGPLRPRADGTPDRTTP